ncbi:MAG TPA: hypothetical protein VH302_04385 [Bryobacteraceae bacterium]|nr:hypothetical protein [Bryobacteraceae bacterium]
MAKTAAPSITDDLPLYIRWSPDRSPYAIELRLDLVNTIAGQIRLSRQSGREMGGFLIGTMPAMPVHTLRIEDVEMISAGLEDSTVFLPEPSRWDALRASSGGQIRNAAIVGFFRTHLRLGPMRPSLADGSMLPDLGADPCVVLLIRAQPPNMAAFFVSENGQLPDEPSVSEFLFDEKEFKSLPEVPHETAAPLASAEELAETGRLGLYTRIAALTLIAVAACALMWSFGRQTSVPRWFPGDSHLHVMIAPENNRLLRISWDKTARALNQASGATLIINEGSARSEVQLGMDDLRLGSVEYQPKGAHVDAQLTVDGPEGPLSSETTRWPVNSGQ